MESNPLYSDDTNVIEEYIKLNPRALIDQSLWYEKITPFIYAIIESRVDVVDLMIKYSVDVNLYKKSFLSTPLIAACSHNNRKIIEILIASGANGNIEDHWGKIPLHYAVSVTDDKNIINLLIPICNPNKLDNWGNTPLITAIKWYASSEIIDILIDISHNINHTNIKGRSAMYYAIQQNEQENINILRLAGAQYIGC